MPKSVTAAEPVTVLSCKGCGSARIRRTHRIGFKEHFYSLAGAYPYHCHKCQARSYHFAKTPPEASPAGGALSVSEVRRERKKSQKRRMAVMSILFAISALVFYLILYFFILVEPASSPAS